MKFNIEASILLSGINRVRGAVEARNTIPILANIVLSAQKNMLTMRGTDLDVEITTSVAAEVATAGEITVNVNLLRELVRKLPKGAHVTFELADKKDHMVSVRSGRSRFKLHTLPVSDFPTMTTGKVNTAFTLAAESLTAMFGKAQFAISNEEARYYLNGVYFHTHRANKNNAPVLRAVATDGHRLAMVDRDAPESAYDMAGVIVPRKTVSLALAMCEQADDVQIELRDGKIAFACADTVLVSKLIDATFPDYLRVVPTGNDKIARIDRADFRSAVDRVATIASENGRAVKVSLTKGKVTMSVRNAVAGEATEEVEADYSADDLDIGFQSAYLDSIVNEIDGDIIKIALADSGSPTLFSGENDSFRAVLMPMRV